MKFFAILILISCTYPVHGMKPDEKDAIGDTVINVQNFMNGTDLNKYPEGTINILDDDTKYQLQTLKDVETFVRNNAKVHEMTHGYIEKYVNVFPSVFVEYYMQERQFDSNNHVVERSLFDVMDKMKNEHNEQYVQNVSILLQTCSSLFNDIAFLDPGKTVRGKKINESKADDPVKPLSLNLQLNRLLSEDLAKKTDESEKKVRSAEKRERIYQFSLALMTLIAAVVPSVLSFVSNCDASTTAGPVFNCSSIV